MNENVMKIIGKSNTGKTRKILFEQVSEEIKKGNNLFLIDNKQEYYNNFYDELTNNGYEVKVVNFKEPLKSNGWDPIEYVKYLYKNNELDKAIEKIKSMGLKIFQKMDSDPFWSQMSSDYFTGVVLSLIKITNEINNDRQCTFASIYNIINDGEKSCDDSIIMKKYLNNFDSMDPIYITLSPTIYSPSDTRGSILSVVRQNLNNLFMRPQLLQSFYNNEFKVSEIKDKTAIFVIGYEPVKYLTNILLEQVYDKVITNNINMTFILDNFDSLIKIDNLNEMINSANNHKIKLFISLKNEDKILELYDKYVFSDIEQVIKLDQIVELSINIIDKSLPKLKDEKPTYINFEEYVNNKKIIYCY